MLCEVTRSASGDVQLVGGDFSSYLVLVERVGLSSRFFSSTFPGRAVDKADWILCPFPHQGFQDPRPWCLQSSFRQYPGISVP